MNLPLRKWDDLVHRDWAKTTPKSRWQTRKRRKRQNERGNKDKLSNAVLPTCLGYSNNGPCTLIYLTSLPFVAFFSNSTSSFSWRAIEEWKLAQWLDTKLMLAECSADMSLDRDEWGLQQTTNYKSFDCAHSLLRQSNSVERVNWDKKHSGFKLPSERVEEGCPLGYLSVCLSVSLSVHCSRFLCSGRRVCLVTRHCTACTAPCRCRIESDDRDESLIGNGSRL